MNTTFKYEHFLPPASFAAATLPPARTARRAHQPL
jgi:hypothetical protein